MKEVVYIMFIVLFSLSSCNRIKIDRNMLTESEKSYIPFQGGEIVTFKSSLGSNLVSYTASTPEIKIIEYPTDHTLLHIWELEQIRVELSSENDKIFFQMTSDLPVYSTDFAFVWENELEFLQAYGHVNFPIDTTDLYGDEILIGDLTVGNKLFHNVFMKKMTNEFESDTISDTLIYPVSFYFSSGYGLIRMDLSDSTSLELESIELK